MEKASTLPKVPTLEADSSLKTPSVEPTIIKKVTAKISRCWTSVTDGIERLNQYKICKPFIFGMKMQFKIFCGSVLTPLVAVASVVISGYFGPTATSTAVYQDQLSLLRPLTTNSTLDLDSISGVVTALIGVFAWAMGDGLRKANPLHEKIQIPTDEANSMLGVYGVLMPWAEEFVFRYLIQDVIMNKIPGAILGCTCPSKVSKLDTSLARIFRVTFTAALFSAYHVFTNSHEATDRFMQVQTIQTFVMGLFLGAIKESSLGFFGAVGLHTATNQYSLLQSLTGA